ncbi:hypothetical protein DXA46_11140 [Bacteroides sp. OF02-3LB]|nr:hypothetical protein DWY71_12550 [Bacteroides sp. AF26-7BH]RGY33470.1 hypothetical protein DXA46_11140 [Bacteroides sp. OF02-3LB]
MNESFNYIIASSDFINASFDYKNKACIYRLVSDKRNFVSKGKEVCNRKKGSFLLNNLSSFAEAS